MLPIFAVLACCISATTGAATCAAAAAVPAASKGQILDISMPMSPQTPVWNSATGAGDFMELRGSIEDGDLYNYSVLKELPAHSGTHVDAPSHFVDGYRQRGLGVESLDLNILNAAMLESLAIPPGTVRILFKTDSSTMALDEQPGFYSAYTALTTCGAEWLLANTAVRLIGIDYLSVSSYEDLIKPHQLLLQKEMIHVEGLVLKHVAPGLYTLHCLPWKLQNSDGAPARCILIA